MKLKSLFSTAAGIVLLISGLAVGRLIYIAEAMRVASGESRGSIDALAAASSVEAGLATYGHQCLLAAISSSQSTGDIEKAAATLMDRVVELQSKAAPLADAASIENVGQVVRSYIERTRSAVNSSSWSALSQLAIEHEAALAATSKISRASIARVDAHRARIAQLDQMTIRGGSIVIALCALVAIVIIVLGRRMIYRPLLDLEQSISSFAAGDRLSRARPSGTTEISQVARVFNATADKLEGQREVQIRSLASVTHDLRNPLNAIIMSIDLLEGSACKSNDERERLFKVISRQVRGLERLVSDFLDTARIEAGHLNLKKESVSISRIVDESVSLFKAISPIHRITVEHESVGGCKVECDAHRIGQVINNLLSNAIKYSPAGGDVRLSVSNSAESVVIEVTDQGLGVAAEEMAHIFEPFRRGKISGEAIPGVGIGLSVSRKIVEAHGGSIELTSKVGQGSTFKVTLPKGHARVEDFKAPRKQSNALVEAPAH